MTDYRIQIMKTRKQEGKRKTILRKSARRKGAVRS